MKMMKSTLLATATAAALSAGVFSAAAHAEVSASASVASMYYWRGRDLGHGTPQVAGDIHYSESGFTAGIWGGSGDWESGTETDLYVGYAGGDSEGFFYDLTAWTYYYPTEKAGSNGRPGKLSELVLGLGYGPVKFSYYDNVAGDPGYTYMTLAGTLDAFTLTLGMHNNADGTKPTHLDLSYAYNDQLKFTVGKIVEPDNSEKFLEDEARFVVSYTLPLEK